VNDLFLPVAAKVFSGMLLSGAVSAGIGWLHRKPAVKRPEEGFVKNIEDNHDGTVTVGVLGQDGEYNQCIVSVRPTVPNPGETA